MTLDAVIRLRLGELDLDMTLTASPGTVVAVLGPNGAGKTTAVRALAGFEGIDDGRIRLDDRPLDEPATGTFVAPADRRIGYVHQGLMLFPHLSVLENVAFGPRSTGASPAEARSAALGWLTRMGLADRAGSHPRALSGGEAQRVALARALVADPALLLLDEPLSALDVTTRTDTRRDLRHHLDDYGGITVLVTHDPLDALLLADQLVILEAGRVTQAGPMAEVTSRPRTPYVADLVGTNLLRGTGSGRSIQIGEATVTMAEPAPAEAFVAIAPSALTLHRRHPESSARNAWPTTVAGIDLLGDRVRIALHGPLPLVAEITPAGLTALGLQVGHEVWVSAKATEIVAYSA